MTEELKTEELEVASGGSLSDTEYIICTHCRKRTIVTCCEIREVREGCSAHYEHKCPYCGEWF